MTRVQLEAWGYFIEFASSCLFTVIVIYHWGINSIGSFVRDSAADISTYFAVVMFATTSAFYWAFYSKSDTPFANWLYDKGAYKVYSRGYLWAIAVYLVLMITLFVAKKVDNIYVSLVAFWMLILGVINAYTFFKNLSEQLKLNMEFNRVMHKK